MMMTLIETEVAPEAEVLDEDMLFEPREER
jgi:hypothetical protein